MTLIQYAKTWQCPGENAPGPKALMLLMILIHSCLLIVKPDPGQGFPCAAAGPVVASLIRTPHHGH